MSTEAQPLISPAVRRQTIADALRRTALRLPQKLGIVCGQTAWTYADFDALVTRLAAGLSGKGVKPGDRVAVLARNSHGFAALRFALARMGAVMVPINFMSAFYLKGVSPPHVTINQIFAGMMPYMFIVILCLILMYIWPELTLWLPNYLYGK